MRIRYYLAQLHVQLKGKKRSEMLEWVFLTLIPMAGPCSLWSMLLFFAVELFVAFVGSPK